MNDIDMRLDLEKKENACLRQAMNTMAADRKEQNERRQEIENENEQLKQAVDALAQEFRSIESLKKENEQLKKNMEQFASDFIYLDETKKENERLKQTVKSLQQQLEIYKKQSRRQYYIERDHVPYHERED